MEREWVEADTCFYRDETNLNCCYFYIVMKNSLVDGTSLDRSVELRQVKTSSSVEERCGINLGSPTNRRVNQIVYERDMPNGGTRKLTIDEKGFVSLTGSDPILELLEGEGDISYDTNYDRVESSLEHVSDLSNYVEQASYDELDEFLLAVEDEADLNYE